MLIVALVLLSLAIKVLCVFSIPPVVMFNISCFSGNVEGRMSVASLWI